MSRYHLICKSPNERMKKIVVYYLLYRGLVLLKYSYTSSKL